MPPSPRPPYFGRHLSLRLTRRVWLPRWVYAVLPSMYLLLGAAALAAATLASGPAWIAPLALLGGVGFAHFGLWVATVRHRHRRGRLPGPASGNDVGPAAA